MLKHQFLSETYSPENLRALESISKQIEASIQKTSEEVQKNDKLLSEYEALGSAFLKVGAEYAEIQKEIRVSNNAVAQVTQDVKDVQ